MPATPAPTAGERIAAALAQRTAAERDLAAAELPILKDVAAALADPALAATCAKLQAAADQLGPGNTGSMLRNTLSMFSGLNQATASDTARHEQTLGQ